MPNLNGLEKLLKSSVTSFVANTIRPVVETDKVIWNARIRRNDLYYRGLQYLSYAGVGNGLADYQAVSSGQNLQLNTGSEQNELYDYILNFLQGDVDTFIAVLGARFPNGQAQARDLSNESNVRLKMKADRVNAYLDSFWNVSTLHPQVVRGIGLYGTMFSYTRYTVNPRRYGNTQLMRASIQEIPLGPAYYQCRNCGTETMAEEAIAIGQSDPMNVEQSPMCPACGNPLGAEDLRQPDSIPSLVPGEVIDCANGAVELSIKNPAHVTTAMWAPDLDHAPWLIDEGEEDKGAIIQAYPELREKAYQDDYRVDAGASSATGRWTRELITSPSGYMIPRTKARWLHTKVWLTPACYEYLPNDRSGQLRDWMLSEFPEGIKIPMVNGEALVGDPQKQIPSRVMNERMTSVWAACKPKPSEMIYCDPYFECMIQMTDTVNDSLNMLVEQAERSNPFVIADPEILGPDELRNVHNIPGEFKFAKPGSVGSLDKGFFRVPAATLNDTLIAFIDKYVSWCREITGIVPAIFGGGSNGPEQTAREAEMRRNQALMKLNTPWNQLRAFWAKTRENGIHQAAKYSGGQLHLPDGRGGVETLDIEGIWELQKGGWYMQSEESMPQTIGQRKDFFMNALNMSPEAQQMIGLGSPNNVVKLQEAVGMSDWDTPKYKMVIRLHDLIGRLTQAEPMPGMPGPPDPFTGMPGPPGPPMPSIPFDSFLFDPAVALEVVRDWLLSDKGMESEMLNPNGYMNVMAYGQSIQQMMGNQTPPPEPPRMSISTTLSDLVPPAQQAVMSKYGIEVNVPPGMPIALPKPVKPMSGEAGPGAESGDEGMLAPPPDQDLLAPPQGDMSSLPPGQIQ